MVLSDQNLLASRFPVAGIFCCENCWGELEAFFGNIHQGSDVIYIVNTPDNASLLMSNLSAMTSLPIRNLEAELKTNTIYLLEDHIPQERFFRDLAVKFTDFAIAVCINDQDRNTTAGFSYVKQHGGITFSNQVAHHLPDALLEVTDFISPIKNIPKQLQLLGSRFEKERLLQRTEAQISESEARFRTIADTAPVLIWMADADKNCDFVNKGWLDFTGRTFEQEIGNGWIASIHPDDLAVCKAMYDKNFDLRSPFTIEYRLLHNSGEYRWISDHAVPRFTADGEFVGYIGGCMDIHKQKTMHDVLEDLVAERTSEIRFQKDQMQQQKEFSDTVFNATIDFMLVYDRDLRFLSFNNAFKKIYGVTDSDIGSSLLDLHPQTRGSIGHSDVLRAIAGEIVHRPVYHSPITQQYYELFLIPLQRGTSVLVVGHDITARIRTEEKLVQLNEQLQLQNKIFRHAEENALIGSYSWKIATGEMKYSDNLFRIFGFEPNAFTPNFDRFIDVIHPDDKAQVIQNRTATVKENRLFENNYRIITPDGIIKHCRSTGNFIGKDDDYMLIGTVQDITKDIALNEILQKQNIDLQNSNEDLASFNYIASHDLQEPLRKISMFAGRILEADQANFSAQTVSYFERIESSILRMQNLIRALLSYSSTNPSDIKAVQTDLNAVLQDAMLSLEEIIAAKNAKIETSSLPTVEVVPIQIQQLFLNLISNAIKYSRPEDAPHIKITSELISYAEKGGEKYWKIAFADNGIGFEQQYRHKIFDLFQRLHGKTDYEGTGVGLAICKKIVQNHNGHITAEGSPGKGSVFTIYIPAKK